MKKKLLMVCCKQTSAAFALMVLLFLASHSTRAQNRNFGIVFSENLKGGTALFGNTLMNAVNANGTVNTTAVNGNSVNGNSLYENGSTTSMQYVDIDGNTGNGTATRNSSSADLILPFTGTNTIKLARLYWGGRAVKTDFDMTNTLNQRIKIRKGTTGAYQEYAAAQLDKVVSNTGTATEFTLYQAFADITPLIQQQGAGTYTVGNGAFSTGTGGDFGNFGAWSIVVVYENPTLNFNSVRVYDGYQQIYSGGNAITNSITLNGLNVPSGALVSTDAKVGIMGWEGDAKYNGDFFKINNNSFSNTLNQVDNPWNGTITNNGVHVTTKFPNYTDQMGIDIDQFDAGTGYGILPNASSVNLQFGTTRDQYFSGVITFVIKMKDPIIELTKKVIDANNNNSAEAGEVLTYKLTGKNIGAGNANAVVLTDVIPSALTFVTGSLKVNAGPFIVAGTKTDITDNDIAEYVPATRTVSFRMGNNANNVNGGYLAFGESFEVEFKATVNTPANGIVPPVINVARLTAKSDALVDYVDDATAVISPQGGPLPVTLTAFTATLEQANQVKIAWSTSMEYNCSRYDVERSTDGVLFNTIASKAGSGNSSLKLSYAANDNVAAVTSAIVYYRLKQFDIDGRASISKVVSVRLKKTAGDFSVSPNPFRKNINVNIEWDKNEITAVKVFSVTGTVIVSKSVKMTKGFNYVAIDELSTVPAGNYIIQFNTSNGRITKQIIKQP
jgi:fimbrial isopeptide formation D2 family protein